MDPIDVEVIRLDRAHQDLATQVVADIKRRPDGDPGRFLDGGDNVAFVAVVDGSAVGWAYGYVLDRPDGDRMMLLYEMEVVAAWRRQGIGRRLVGACREAAKEAECASMWLITDEANVSAQMLYQLEGATVEGTRTQFAWRGLSGG